MDPRPRLIAYYMEVWDLSRANAVEVAAWDFARALARANAAGATCTELARRLGLTRARVHQMVQKGHRLRRTYARSGTYRSPYANPGEDPYQDPYWDEPFTRLSRLRARRLQGQLGKARFIIGKPGESYPLLKVTFT